jgi:hypothetical protein
MTFQVEIEQADNMTYGADFTVYQPKRNGKGHGFRVPKQKWGRPRK